MNSEAHRMFESHRMIEGLQINALKGSVEERPGPTVVVQNHVKEWVLTMDCSSSRSSCSGGSGSGSKVAADQDLDSDRRFRISVTRYR